MLADIASNVIANIVFWLGLGLAAAATVRVGQRRFRRFFGLDANQQLAVCLSNTWNAETSARPRGYSVSLHELRAAEAVTRLFGSASFRLPDLVRGLVDAIYLGGHRYDFHMTVSPAPADDPKRFAELGGNLVVVGAAARNGVRGLYLDENLVNLRLGTEAGADERFVEVLGGADVGRRITSDSLELAVVERVHDAARGTTVVFCLGRHGDTTWAATEYLVRNWRGLEKEFGDRPFALCLGFQDLGYGYDYRPPRRLDVLRG
ncbi:hypothetical protein [Lentzea sp. NPDC060358]|uniref:hypothetical protein n=1 Tax=Lentzea sp. NPDC060358 TaxID=3347103 RepID=UPI003652E0C1